VVDITASAWQHGKRSFPRRERLVSSPLSNEAIERTLALRRERSTRKVLEIVDAARVLAAGSGATMFTMQQVAERAGVSSKTIYRYFPGKDDLLLALIEEDCERGAVLLGMIVDRHTDPLARLEASVTGVFDLMAAGDTTYITVLVRELMRLSEIRRESLHLAISPLVHVIEREIRAADVAGVVTPVDAARDARTAFDLAVLTIADLVLGAPPASTLADTAAYLWSFVAHGLAVAHDRSPTTPETLA
jgi:TetR/AcrR family transcriptional regulator